MRKHNWHVNRFLILLITREHKTTDYKLRPQPISYLSDYKTSKLSQVQCNGSSGSLIKGM